MISNSKFVVRGGFSLDNLIGQPEDLNAWFQKETEKQMREKDPILRAFNLTNLSIKDNILPANPMSQEDIQNLDRFPFNQINCLAAPGTSLKKVLEIQNKLPEEILTVSDISTSEASLIAQKFDLSASKASEFLKYIRGEIKTF